MNILESHEQEINRRHLLAHAAANDAIEHAKAAGVLLLEIKSRLRHGQFLRWVKENTKISLRQAQRYMAVALGKQIPLRKLINKSDTVSHLKKEQAYSEGLWVNDQWQPEPGFVYRFEDETGSYWVAPSAERAASFHVCKHYKGGKVSSNGFYWRYTIFGVVSDPELTSEFYMGTRWPLTSCTGVAEVLQSYGLKNLKESFRKGRQLDGGARRPYGEPSIENWYWDSEMPDDDLFKMLVARGHLNANGAITFLG